jgi:hypothetical protein
MIQLWSAIAVAILTVVIGPLLRGEASGRLAKRIALHADMRPKLEGNAVALKHLDSLLANEAKALEKRETYRLTRKLNGGNVAALIFVALAGGGVVYGLISGAIATEAVPAWPWVFIVLAALAGIFTIALAAVGLGTLYAAPREKAEKSATSE